MNKLVFDAQIIGLKSVDYEYLQDSMESYSNKLYRQLLSNPNTPAIIQGFDLQIDSLDNTKLKVDTSSMTGLSGLITQDSTIVETSTGISSISLSNYTYGTINYVYAHYYTIKGSYDIATDTIYEDVKSAIDLSDYSLDYNRQMDKVEIVVMTAAEYSLLTSTGDYIYLGSTVAQGSGQPLVSVDKTGLTYTILALPPAQIEVSNLSPSFLLPQTMVDNSDSVNDTYYGTPINIENDLNRIRTEIKNVKGTPTWEDTTEANLLAFDPTPNKLHLNGISSEYGTNFTTTVYTSLGSHYARIESGKALFNGDTVTIYGGQYEYRLLPELTINYYGYNSNPPEGHYPVHTGTNFILTEFTNGAIINSDSLRLYGTLGNLYEITTDYTYTASTGQIHMIAETIDGFVYAWYEYGYRQYQSVDLTSTGIFAVQAGNSSYPPYPSLITGLRLYNILRNPFIDPITSDLIDCKNYLHQVREVSDIYTQNYTTVPFTVDKFTYYTAAGAVDTTFSQWTVTSTGTSFVTTSINGAYAISCIHCRANDELYFRITKPLSGNSYNVTISYEATPGTNIFTNVSFTNIQESSSTSDNVLFFVVKGLTEGYHRIKITNNTVVGTLKFYGIVYGKLDSYYTKDNVIFNGNSIIKGTIEAQNIDIPTTTSSVGQIKINNIPVFHIYGAGNIFVGQNSGNLITSGSDNTVVGQSTGSMLTTGSNNTLIGYQSGNTITTGSNNIIIGKSAAVSAAISNSIVIGTSASIATSNQIYLGNTGITSTIIKSPIVNINNSTIKAWNTSLTAIYIGDTGSIWGHTIGVNQFCVSYNAYYDASSDKYMWAGAASRYEQTSGVHIFRTAPTGSADGVITTFFERLRIANTGEVGIGVTPKIWNLGNVLQIGGISSIYGYSGAIAGSDLCISVNAYLSGGPWNYIIADYATEYRQVSGYHVFHTAISGTINAAIPYIERIRIQNSNSAAAPTLCGTSDIDTGIWWNGSNLIGFSTAGIERLRITAGGIISMNNSSPGNWDSGGISAFQIGFASAIWAHTASIGQFCISHNAQFDAGEKYLQAGTASRYEQTGGAHEFKVATSGLAGGTIPWNEILRVDNSGTILTGGIAGTCALELGGLLTGNRNVYIDFHGDDTYTDYGLRIIRNGGLNATSGIYPRGTGNFSIYCAEAANIIFATSNIERVVITSAGYFGINCNPGNLFTLNAGSLGGTAGNSNYMQRIYATGGNVDNLYTYLYRVSTGTGWDTAYWRIQRCVDVTNKAFIQFGLGVSGGGDDLVLGANNAEKVRIQSTSTAAAPTLVFDSELNTGLRRSGAGLIGISTSGVEGVRIGNGSNGVISFNSIQTGSISFNTPTSGLYIQGSSDDNSLKFNFGTSSTANYVKMYRSTNETTYIEIRGGISGGDNAHGYLNFTSYYSEIITNGYLESGRWTTGGTQRSYLRAKSQALFLEASEQLSLLGATIASTTIRDTAPGGYTVTINADGVLGSTYSSLRRKTNIENLDDVSFIYKLNPVKFEYKKSMVDKNGTPLKNEDGESIYLNEGNGIKNIGLIAEDVDKIEKTLVVYDSKNRPDGIRHIDFISVLIKAVQDHKKEIDTLKAEIQTLKNN